MKTTSPNTGRILPRASERCSPPPSNLTTSPQPLNVSSPSRIRCQCSYNAISSVSSLSLSLSLLPSKKRGSLANPSHPVVQFYNSPACEIDAPGFNASIISWTKNLNASTLSPKPRLYIGAPAWTDASPMAYKEIIGGPQGMKKVVSGVRELMAQNGVGGWLGGVMFWDVSLSHNLIPFFFRGWRRG
jgi:hypothetical protein